MRARLSAGAVSASLHLALAVSLLWPATPAISRMPAGRKTATIVTAPAEDETYPGLNPVPVEEDAPRFASGRTTLEFDNTSFDISKIAERYDVLFPFLTPGLSLDLFALTPQDDFTTFLNGLSHYAGPKAKTGMTPLVLDAGGLRRLIDRTWSRRDRWKAMQPLLELAQRYDPNTGDLSQVFRSYGEENMGQYYVDRNSSIRDPRLWAELALAADHVSMVAFVRRYATDHPSTRSTTELLFILDKVIEGNRNILATLQSTIPPYHLLGTQRLAPDAYAVILRIQQHYDDVLRARHLLAPESVSAVYDDVRLKVLAGILHTTPQSYRASDARFLIGRIHWQAGRIPEAFSSWCQMRPGPTDVYSDLSSAVLTVLQSQAPTGVACAVNTAPPSALREIRSLLNRDDSRAWNLQYERLRRFGYSVDTFSPSKAATRSH